MLAGEQADSQAESERVAALRERLESEQDISAEALARVADLNDQVRALRRQIAALQEALDASEERAEESQARLADLGRRLNIALAERVQILSRFRSDFFGRLRDILAERAGIEVVGDRFVFQSEVLFPSGSARLNAEGREELSKLADELDALAAEIPEDIDWVLRVDGHTDERPVAPGGAFDSNWELSSARAISVVQYLIDEGVPPDRLVAAGFGEFQPLVDEDTEEAYARNRRIELKVTQR
jgi:chemotaxis protein MotB